MGIMPLYNLSYAITGAIKKQEPPKKATLDEAKKIAADQIQKMIDNVKQYSLNEAEKNNFTTLELSLKQVKDEKIDKDGLKEAFENAKQAYKAIYDSLVKTYQDAQAKKNPKKLKEGQNIEKPEENNQKPVIKTVETLPNNPNITVKKIEVKEDDAVITPTDQPADTPDAKEDKEADELIGK